MGATKKDFTAIRQQLQDDDDILCYLYSQQV
jgi:hypothetical protein